MFKTIVVATDGSPHGDKALATASEMAREENSRILVVHVVEFVGGKGGVYPMLVDEPEVKGRIRAAVDALKTDGMSAELLVQEVGLGGPARSIAAAAAAADADLIVVGSKGRSEIADIVLGSVPMRLLHIAHRPVLVVPRDEA
jgi:nucleotide-binding universal stress UspA family protein